MTGSTGAAQVGSADPAVDAAPAGTLPFTGPVLVLVALAGLLALGTGMTGRWATATR